MIPNETADELARLCTLDLGQEITRAEVQGALLVGFYPVRLSPEERSDMFCTLVKEMDRMNAEKP